MSTKRPAAGGGSEILVPAERALKWLDGFDTRHCITRAETADRGIRVFGEDGSSARCFLPLPVGWSAPDDADSRDLIELFAHTAVLECRIAVVFARRGAVAVGVFEGARLLASKIDKSYVQGRTAAGGWSQQRYARRRSKQARQAGDKAADIAVGVLTPWMATLRGVVTAGHRPTAERILDDPRLNGLSAFGPQWPGLLEEDLPRRRRYHARPRLMHVGDVGEPRLESLKKLPKQFRVVRILLHEPDDQEV